MLIATATTSLPDIMIHTLDASHNETQWVMVSIGMSTHGIIRADW